MACVRVCPADAVAVEGTQIRIVDETCTRCGLCLPACPHDAIKAAGDVPRALELALSGRAALILGVECAVFFYPATPEQVVNACYAAGFRIVHRGVLGDELVAKEYLKLWADEGWGSMIRSTCPVIVETVRTQYPELIPYLAPIATPIAAEARYLKGLHGPDTPLVYAGVCLTEGGRDVDAAITFEELADLFRRRGVKVENQAPYFTRVPEERRRHLSTAGGLPLELLMEETHASRRFRKVRGLGGLEAIARAVAVDRIDVGFVDILPCEGCLDHPLLGPPNELFRRREIVGATEPARRGGRWWRRPWRAASGWARHSRSCATVTGRRPKRSQPCSRRSGSRPTAGPGTAARAVTPPAARSPRRPRRGAPRSNRARRISTRWAGRRSCRP